MHRKHIYSDINKDNWRLFMAIYPVGNNNSRKMHGEPLMRRVHIYEEKRKKVMGKTK